MKRAVLILLVLLLLVASFACAEPSAYVLTEDTFFRVMTNINAYPHRYDGKDLTFDSFTYRLTDVDGTEYMCCVRKCSAGYGCKCGKDTVIGFILDYDGDIPEPKDQSADTVEKTWIRTTGKLVLSEDRKPTVLHIYAADGVTVEPVSFFTYHATELSLIEDYSGLQYYVTK